MCQFSGFAPRQLPWVTERQKRHLWSGSSSGYPSGLKPSPLTAGRLISLCDSPMWSHLMSYLVISAYSESMRALFNVICMLKVSHVKIPCLYCLVTWRALSCSLVGVIALSTQECKAKKLIYLFVFLKTFLTSLLRLLCVELQEQYYKLFLVYGACCHCYFDILHEQKNSDEQTAQPAEIRIQVSSLFIFTVALYCTLLS